MESSGNVDIMGAMKNSSNEYLVITGAYWVFTLTDGALRMLILLHLHELGMGPLAIASLFLFYEFFGVLTNVAGGWLGARFGLKTTLFFGLALQIAACFGLTVDPSRLSIFRLTLIQSMSGVAKDLTKMSAKSYVKLVVPAHDRHGLMRWVAILTGSKNTLKGLGFFLGAFLMEGLGFAGACQLMAGALMLALIFATTMLPRAPGRASAKPKLDSLWSRDLRINWLAAARFFLFGSRDIWFVLALPVFLAQTLGWSREGVGAFLALWIIGYGVVQASTPGWIRNARKAEEAPDGGSLIFWTGILILPLAALAAAIANGHATGGVLASGLALFGVIFAVNSALHSYLIVDYAKSDNVSRDVGFYYAANAAGRLVGTLLSGWLYQAGGLGRRGLLTCMAASMIFVLGSWLCLPSLRRAERSESANTPS